jgi:hypothetical protein
VRTKIHERSSGAVRSLIVGLTLAVSATEGRTIQALGAEKPGRFAVGSFDQEHTVWTSILSRFVKDGVVDYAGLKASAAAELGRYLSSLGSVRRADYQGWTREQKLAFWINAYNAATVQLILDNYPISSIRKIGLLPGAAFRLPVLTVPAYRESELSLTDIENSILRAEFHEPRIHFAIVCASKSCPKLQSEAYRASDLDAQLERVAREFARDPAKNRYDASSRELRLSSIFKWFREDFETASGSLPTFFVRFAEPAVAKAIGDGKVKVGFLEYDWTVNGRTP